MRSRMILTNSSHASIQSVSDVGQIAARDVVRVVEQVLEVPAIGQAARLEPLAVELETHSSFHT